MTEHLAGEWFTRDRGQQIVRLLVCVSIAVSASVVPAGCSSPGRSDPAAETEATGTPKGHGVVVDVRITPEMLANKPAAPTLTTPEAAVRTYLDWISYAYRIGDSDVAKPVMGAYEEVRVNSYVQFNLQEHNRVVDQELDAIEFGAPVSKDASTTLLPANEKWTYRWVSAQEAGKVLGGPFSASYDTTYTVVQKTEGSWIVESVEVKKLGADK